MLQTGEHINLNFASDDNNLIRISKYFVGAGSNGHYAMITITPLLLHTNSAIFALK